ncbi:MAG TPA: nuclear transport factor 2 family protein [Candidatus Binatia bacterium]|nr:nuclear transport factor 2 family protein [Candidatus Binatia bacterium]
MASDRDEILDLIYGYAERLDEGDFEAVADLFAEATFRSDRRPEVRRGRDEVLAVYRSTVATYEGKPSTKHVTTNAIVEIAADGASASANSYFTVFQARPELSLQPIIAGRYRDRFVKRDGRWRFADRLVLMDLIGDLRFHLKRDVTSA